MSEDFTSGLPEDEMSFSFRKKAVADTIQEHNWKKVEEAISAEAPVRNIYWMKSVAVAASLLLILCTGVWYYTSQNDSSSGSVYKTDYAKIKKITLPDGSVVTLNANSELKLSANWTDIGERQVWLEGEAYFEVAKKETTQQKFIVHTKDVDVEVLGTKFNVNTRHEKSIVALEEGKIKLTLNQTAKAALKAKATTGVFEIKPGEIVVLDTVSGLNISSVANAATHSGWVRNEFHFDNTSLQEVSAIIQDIYGYKVVVADETLLQRTISGDLRADNLKELVEVLQLAYNLKMTIDNKTIRVAGF
ncbi:MAG TPA: FecR domain-containing protein [Ferruginibacter sp.]|nr:FecR domain-containing protein [Ferruginibacter sp.]HMP19424.1 FecR domain-containing protein [Ferruginibacter sp.]